MLDRPLEIRRLRELIDVFPVTAILGARQIGKSTLAHQIQSENYFDLENPTDLVKFENPQFLLEPLKGLIVIDEIQRKPDLFPFLRYQCDNRPDQKFLILGSASSELMRNSSETLAGRIGYHFLGGFRLDEIGENVNRLWLQGGFPKAFLLESKESVIWRQNFITTFLERDIPQLGISIPSSTLRRFWTMLSHYHGQILNFSELSRSFGVSDMTVRRYIEILEGTFMIRLINPWYANVGKRLVKAPKLYFRDTGILHTLLTIDSVDQLVSHNKLGASWEGFCIENAIRVLGKRTEEVYFYSTHSGAEIDLFWQANGKNYALEVKFTETPRVTKSMNVAVNDLQIEKAWIVYSGKSLIKLTEKVDAIPITMLDEINQ